MKRLLSALVSLALSLLLVQACTNSAARREVPEAHTDEHGAAPNFYALVSRVQFNYQTMKSVEALARESSLVVVGRIVSISEGRTFFGGPEDPNSMRTAVARVAVDETLRGTKTSEVYVAFWRTQVSPLEAFQASVPKDRLILLLDEADTQPQTHDQLRGVPTGQTLYELASPQGLIAEKDGQAEQPLAHTSDVIARGPFQAQIEAARVSDAPAVHVGASEAQVAANRRCAERTARSIPLDAKQPADNNPGGTRPNECE